MHGFAWAFMELLRGAIRLSILHLRFGFGLVRGLARPLRGVCRLPPGGDL